MEDLEIQQILYIYFLGKKPIIPQVENLSQFRKIIAENITIYIGKSETQGTNRIT
jgi:hypothetical protein